MPQPGAAFTSISWWLGGVQVEKYLQTFALEPGQQLTFSSLSLYLATVTEPFGSALDLHSLAPSRLFQVPPGAVLEFEDVTMVLPEAHLQAVHRGLCSSTSAWPYSPGVLLDGRVVRINTLATRHAGPGGGGAVRWRNVTLTCPGYGLQALYPCTAMPVASADELQQAAMEHSASSASGPLLLSLAADVRLPADNGWRLPPVPLGTRLVLLGDPGRCTTLDLAGRERVWEQQQPPSKAVLDPWSVLPMAYLADLTLVNLPLASQPGSPGELLALAVNSFGMSSSLGVLAAQPGLTRLTLTRCTLVVPDLELAFLGEMVRRNASKLSSAEQHAQGDGLSGFFTLELQVPGSAADLDLASGRLAVAVLKLPPQVLLLNCTLLSASAYEALPGALPLLPTSNVWLPRLLYDSEEVALTRGPAGVTIAGSFREALSSVLQGCGRPQNGALAALLYRRNDQSASELAIGPATSAVAVEAKEGICVISGRPTGDRVFVDLKGLASIAVLQRSLTLRNLVLYNLAPGGVELSGLEAAWVNSSLPLWFFSFDRAAGPLLRLDNVTLVIPEQEWRALVAAVLMRHAPEELQAAQTQPRPPPRSYPPRSAEFLGPPGAPPPPGFLPRNTPPLDEPSMHSAGPPGSLECTVLPGYTFRQGQDAPFLDVGHADGALTDYAAACSADCKCKAFNTNGWLKKTSSLEDSLGLPGPCEGTYVRTSPVECNVSECPQFPGYTFQSRQDALLGENLYHVDGFVISSYADACSADCQCKAFDTNGWLKSALSELASSILPGACEGVYLRDAPVDCGGGGDGGDGGGGDGVGGGYVGGGAIDPLQGIPSPDTNPSDVLEQQVPPSGLEGPAEPQHEMDQQLSPDLLAPPDTLPPMPDAPSPHDGRTLPLTYTSAQLFAESSKADAPLGFSNPPDAASPTQPPPRSPAPPPLPLYSDAASLALLQFASSSVPESYDAAAGLLVLRQARHYGWEGSRVTLSYMPPPDTPPTASFKTYPQFELPYQALADLNLGFEVTFSPTRPAPMPGTNEPLSPAIIEAPAPPAVRTPNTPPADPVLVTDLGSNVDDNGRSGGGSSSGRKWFVPVAATLSAVGGTVLAAVAAVITAAALAARRRSRVESKYGANKGAMLTVPPLPLPGVRCRACSSPVSLGSGSTVRGCGSCPCGTGGANLGGLLQSGPSVSLGDSLEAPRGKDLASEGTALTTTGNYTSFINTRTSSIAVTVVQANQSAVNRALLRAAVAAGDVAHRYRHQPPSGGELSTWSCTIPTTLAPSALESSTGDTENRNVGPSSNSDEPSYPDASAFPQLVSAYFTEMRELTAQSPAQPPSKNGSCGLQDSATSPTAHPRAHRSSQPGASRGVADAIRFLQAELQDSELEVHAVLGHGAYGVVYRGLWRGLPVAVKTLVVADVTVGSEGRARQRAVLEAAISMAMAHPNVVATYSYDLKQLVQAPLSQLSGASEATAAQPAADGTVANCIAEAETGAYKLYIVQELCNAGSLRHALGQGMAGCVRGGGSFRLLALRLALDVALGMKHVHSCRIVHGDLKPDNVLLAFGTPTEPPVREAASIPATRDEGRVRRASHDAAGGSGLPALAAKVADFGLSMPLSEGATHASNKFHGTPAYAAPEVMASGRLSPRADVWSFGLMLIELFYGCTLSDMRVLQAMVMGQAASGALVQLHAWLLQDMARSPHQAYAELAAACLSLEPRGRPDFGEIVERLQAELSSSGDQRMDW